MYSTPQKKTHNNLNQTRTRDPLHHRWLLTMLHIEEYSSQRQHSPNILNDRSKAEVDRSRAEADRSRAEADVDP